MSYLTLPDDPCHVETRTGHSVRYSARTDNCIPPIVSMIIGTVTPEDCAVYCTEDMKCIGWGYDVRLTGCGLAQAGRPMAATNYTFSRFFLSD